jgi:hypothetical protein
MDKWMARVNGFQSSFAKGARNLFSNKKKQEQMISTKSWHVQVTTKDALLLGNTRDPYQHLSAPMGCRCCCISSMAMAAKAWL